MRPILRDLRTGLYFKGGATWTWDAGQALVYDDIERALEAARNSSMGSLELNVLFFDDPRFTIRLALDKMFYKPAGVSCVPPRNALGSKHVPSARKHSPTRNEKDVP